MPVCLCPVGAPSEMAVLYNPLGLYGCHGSISHDDHIPTQSNLYDWCCIWYDHKRDNNVLYENRCRSVGNDISGLYHSAYVSVGKHTAPLSISAAHHGPISRSYHSARKFSCKYPMTRIINTMKGLIKIGSSFHVV